jgi:hypothetical protein
MHTNSFAILLIAATSLAQSQILPSSGKSAYAARCDHIDAICYVFGFTFGPTTAQEYACAARDLEDVRELGKGAFGRVRLVIHRPTNTSLAVKVYLNPEKTRLRPPFHTICLVHPTAYPRLHGQAGARAAAVGSEDQQVGLVSIHCAVFWM